MKLDTFFDNFALLADTLNGVQKLREMVLQLAVQGKLVPQNPKDEPASVLLEKINAEKERLVKEKKIKKSKPFPLIKSDIMPYELPNGWEWTRLAEIGLINPRNEVGDETKVSFVPMKLVPTSLSDRVESEICQWGDIKNGFTHFAEGDVALAKITPCFQNRKSAVMHGLKNGFGAGTTELHIFRPINNLIISEYVLLFLKTPKFIREGVSKMTGSAGQKRVPKTYFSETPSPLPPTNEQKRIVAKVDELMALCDELEASKQQISLNCIQLNDASIHELLTASEPKKFSKHWQRICDNFELLYSKPENVNKLRQAILQLAIQGKLVPQDPKDEPASVLFERIIIERKRLIKEKNIKRDNPLPPFTMDEIPFELPNGWVWKKLGELCIVKGGKRVPKGSQLLRTKTPYIYIRVTDMKNMTINTNGLRYISKKVYNQIKNYTINKDDIYITIAGTIGVVGELPDMFDGANLTENAAKLMFSGFNKKFLIWTLHSNIIQKQFQNSFKQMAQPKLALNKIASTLFPFPPLNEQKRIVAKVDELMALCNELETSLSKSQTDCDRLMEAAVAEILAA